MKFIKLTNNNGYKKLAYWVNINSIKSIYQKDTADAFGFNTCVEFSDGTFTYVEEPPELIIAMIENFDKMMEG